MSRSTTTGCLALVFSVAVSLASAGTPAGATAPDPRAAQPAETVDTSTIDDAALSAPCAELVPEPEEKLFTPASGHDAVEAVETDAAPAGQARKPMRGYCRCTCSFIPNCSTNADCGGGLCLKGPTCC